MNDPLLVGVVGLAVEGRIAESGDQVLLDGHPLLRPLSVDSAGLFVFPSQNALP